MRQTWISVRCRFHQSAASQFSKMISRSTVTQFSLTISGLALAECVWQFHVVAINLFLLSIWYVGIAVDSTLQLSLRFELWFQGLQRLCFRSRFLVRSDAVSLAIPCVNDDSVFSIDFMRQMWISVRCRFHQSAKNSLQVCLNPKKISYELMLNIIFGTILTFGNFVQIK